MGLKQRSQQRQQRMVGHLANGFADAERWDLEYWQRQPPEARLAALVAIQADVAAVERGRVRASRQRRAA